MEVAKKQTRGGKSWSDSGPRTSNTRTSGFILLEVVTYLALLGVVGGAVATTLLVSIRTTTENRIMNEVAERNRVAIHRIAEGVRPALQSSLVSFDEDELQFTLPSTYDGSNVVLGDTIRFEFRTENGQGRLFRENLTTGEEVVICRKIDVAASKFDFNGAAVTMTIVNSAEIPHSGSSHVVSNSLTVRTRN